MDHADTADTAQVRFDVTLESSNTVPDAVPAEAIRYLNGLPPD